LKKVFNFKNFFLFLFLIFILVKFFIPKKTEEKSSYKDFYTIENTFIFFENIQKNDFLELKFAKNFFSNTEFTFPEKFTFGISSDKIFYFVSDKEIFITSDKNFSKISKDEKFFLIFSQNFSEKKIEKTKIKTFKNSFGAINQKNFLKFLFKKDFSTIENDFKTFDLSFSEKIKFSIPKKSLCNLDLEIFETKFCVDTSFFQNSLILSQGTNPFLEFLEMDPILFFKNISSAEVSSQKISVDFFNSQEKNTKLFFWIISNSIASFQEKNEDGTFFDVLSFKNFEIPEKISYSNFEISCFNNKNQGELNEKKSSKLFCIAEKKIL